MKAHTKVNKILRNGFKPAGTYGVQVTGMRSTQMRSMRASFHRAIVDGNKGRGCTLDLALAQDRLDPAYDICSLPIAWWVAGLREQWIPRHMLLRTFSDAMVNVEADDFKKVRGPASAAVASMKRIGWEPLTLITWKTCEGGVINIDDMCPRTVQELAMRDTETWLWNASTSAKITGIEGRPFLEPIKALLNTKESEEGSMSRAAKGMLRCLVAHGIWSPERLKAAGYDIEGVCPHCGGCGSLWHLIWDCPATYAFRLQWGLPDAIKKGANERWHMALWGQDCCRLYMQGCPSLSWLMPLSGRPCQESLASLNRPPMVMALDTIANAIGWPGVDGVWPPLANEEMKYSLRYWQRAHCQASCNVCHWLSSMGYGSS